MTYRFFTVTLVFMACFLILGCSESDDGNEPSPAQLNSPTNLRVLATGINFVQIEWTDNATDEDAYYVERSPQNNQSYGQIAALPANTQTYNDTGLVSGATYYYRVCAGRGTYHSAYSNEVQAAAIPNVPPDSPVALFPVDGATNTTLSLTFRWSANDMDGDTLCYDVYLGKTTSPALISSNQQAVSLPQTGLDTNTQYYWKVVAKDWYFETPGPVWTFRTGTGGPSICVVYPNGGETLLVGSASTVMWESNQLVGTVDILLSVDGGNNWPYIMATAVTNTGSYSWTPTQVYGPSCRVRIQSMTNPAVYDESDGDFVVCANPSIHVIYPNGGETLLVGSTLTVMWGWDQLEGTVDILLSVDGGTNWPYVVATGVTNDGYYWWTSTQVYGPSCRLRIQSTTNPAVYDESDGDFVVCANPWINQASGTSASLKAVAFVDANHGWAVGNAWMGGSGTILHTTDGGDTWTDQPSGTSRDLRAVAFVDANHGWAVGWNGAILHTTNGGATWTAQTSGTTDGLFGVAFVDGDHGWAVGWNGAILHTTDGGDTWTDQPSGTSRDLRGVAFVDANHGWAVGWNGAILHTTNGGDTWTDQPSGTTDPLWGVAFVDASNGWAVGYGGTILHTIDGGAHWAFQTNGTSSWLRGVAFVDAYHGWAVGDDGTILHTSTGGD